MLLMASLSQAVVVASLAPRSNDEELSLDHIGSLLNSLNLSYVQDKDSQCEARLVPKAWLHSCPMYRRMVHPHHGMFRPVLLVISRNGGHDWWRGRLFRCGCHLHSARSIVWVCWRIGQRCVMRYVAGCSAALSCTKEWQ